MTAVERSIYRTLSDEDKERVDYEGWRAVEDKLSPSDWNALVRDFNKKVAEYDRYLRMYNCGYID